MPWRRALAAARGLRRLALGVLALGPLGGRAAEPLSEWLEGIGEAAQAQSEGRHGAAEKAARAALAARPAGFAGARARAAVGLALRGRRRFSEAGAILAAASAGADPALAAALREPVADALFYGGHPAAAAAHFAAMAAASLEPQAARWREADAILVAGLPAAAARAYEALLADSPDHPAAAGARLSLAAAYRSLGEDDRAVAQYRRVWLDFPGDLEGRAAGGALRRWRRAGGPVPEPTPEDRLSRAERLLGQAMPRRALAELDRLDALAPGSPPPRSRLLRALAELAMGRPAGAEELARPLAAPGADAAERPAALLVLARATARLGRTDEASDLYRRLAAAPPASVPGLTASQTRDLPDEAAYLSAWLYYDGGRFAEAVERLGAFLRQHPGSRRAEDARWFRAWSLYRMHRRDRAARELASLEDGPVRAAALYWQARLAAGARRQASLYRAAAEEAQGGWYALLAGARLAELGQPAPGPPAAPAPPDLEEAPAGAAGAAFDRAGALLGLGLRAAALAELEPLSRRPGSAAPLLAQLAEAAGDPEIPFRMARDHLPPTSRARRWAHPFPFAKALAASASGFGIDPLLLAAVMRRESGFRREARSGAAAEGLLQLVPPTSERLAAILGLRRGLARRLSEPEVSVAFGAYYLGLLKARFGDTALVLAAYNAGPAEAASWARQRAGLPLDEWVEDIPFRETRHYVRTVMADYALYRRLYGAGDAPLDPGRPVEAPGPGVEF